MKLQHLKNLPTLYKENLTLFFNHLNKRRQASYLLPLRLFIGLGWLRAGLEKFIDPMWHSGYNLQQFFEEQIVTEQIPFFGYESLVVNFFNEQLVLLSGLIIIGQLLCGIAVFTGTLTTPALLAAMFMNLNFMLVGKVNPSAFYLMMELVLLQSNAGLIWGVDAWLNQKWRLLPTYPLYSRYKYYYNSFTQGKLGLTLTLSFLVGVCLAFNFFATSIRPLTCLENISMLTSIQLFSSYLNACVDLKHLPDDPAIFLCLFFGFLALSVVLSHKRLHS